MDDEMIEDEFEFEPDPTDAACEFIEPGRTNECGAEGLIYLVASDGCVENVCAKHLPWVHAGEPHEALSFAAFRTVAVPA